MQARPVPLSAVSSSRCKALPVMQRPAWPARRAALSCRASASPADAYQRLQGLQVLRATDGQSVELVKQWGAGQQVMITWTRSLGCPFCQELALQLTRDVKPKLDALGIRLYMVTIGTPERSKDFVARTGFPIECLLLDPDQYTYKALGFKNNVQDTFFNIATPLSLIKRFTSGKAQDLLNIFNGWQPWMTPKGPMQALQQGGTFVFEGERLLWSHLDKATADHAQPSELIALAESVTTPQARDCGCDAPAATNSAS